MDADPLYSGLPQLALFKISESHPNVSEFLPQLWAIGEALASPRSDVRLEALEQLSVLGVARYSPLMAYLLATRIADPDMACRIKSIELLGEILEIDPNEPGTSGEVKIPVVGYLSRMRTRELFALLQVLDARPEAEKAVLWIIKICSFAGRPLVDIASNRNFPLNIRSLSVRMLGVIGFVEALPDLERLLSRLEMRLNTSPALPYTHALNADESKLIPELREALRLLRMP
ncbi:MAG: hypothetical protein PHD58_07980 [Anaerolineales bacterium]|nr:hypothetical protein [Anaerolineales bacterium]